MMKKLLSVLLALCMIFSMFIFPANAEEEIEGTYEHYWSIDFSENKLYTDYDNPVKPDGYDYNFKAIGFPGKYEVDYKALNEVPALRVRASGGEGKNISVVPLMEDGKPIVLEPGKTYKVSYSVFVTRLAKAWQSVSLAPYPTVDGSALDAEGKKNLVAHKADGTTLDWSSNANKLPQHSLYRSVEDKYFGEPSYIGGTKLDTYKATGEAVTASWCTGHYNASGHEISKSHTVQMATEETLEDTYGVVVNGDGTYTYTGTYGGGSGTHTYSNLLALELPGCDGEYYAKGTCVDALETKTLGNDVGEAYRLFSEYYITKLEVAEVAEVTFNYKDKNPVTVETTVGAAIEYPTLVAENANNMYDAVWSLSADEYLPVPEVFDGEALTVYEFRRTDKQSFESYNQNYAPVNNKFPTNATITDELACEGSKSIKYDNRNLQLFENHWLYGGNIGTYWPEQWKNCYSYNAETDVYTQLSGNTPPTFENGKYYIDRSSAEKDQGMFMVKGLGDYGTYSYSYKITFKYYVPNEMAQEVKISTKQISTQNFWNSGDIKDLNTTFVIPKTATNGWKTGELYVSADNLAASTAGGQVIAFKVDTATTTNANARNCVVYFDDVVCENYTPTPTVIYHHNDGVTVDKVVTDGIVAGANDIAYVPETAPAGKYFMGWYTDEALTTSAGTTFTVPTSPSSGIKETDLYAKWGNYADGDIFNFEGITDKPATGYAYMKDDVYSRVDGINETGWAYKSFTEDGVVLGKGDGGNAFKWDPSLAQKEGIVEPDKTGSASDLVAVAATASQDVGEQYTVGWASCSNYIVKDANGNAVIAKPNTKYAVLMTYKVLASGSVDLYIGMGRKDDYLTTGANAIGAKTYNSKVSEDVFTIGTDKLTGETDTFTYYIDTSDFTGVAPVVSIHCVARGYLGERLDKDSDGVESYQVNGVTYYPHRIVSAPRVAIKEITLIEIEGDNPVVTYKYYEEGEGFSAVIKDAPVGTPIDVPTNNVDPNWYSNKEVQSIENISEYPSANTTVYNADYMMAPGNVVFFESCFFGTQFEKRFTEKDGQDVPAIYFNSVGYDEFMEGKNPAVDANINEHVIADPDDATKLSEVKDHYGKSTQLFRMGKAVDGHTYKVSFSIKADKFEADMGVHFASGTANNIWDTTTKLADYNDITKSKVNAVGSWYDFTYYVTYDAAGYYDYLPDVDDSKKKVSEYFYIWFSQNITAHNLAGCDNEIYIADIVYEDLGVAVGKNGASILNDVAMQTATSQAMRFYFTYATEDGTKIKLGNEEFEVVERGFIYQNGAIGTYTKENGKYTGLLLSTAGIKKSAKTDGFENCWDYKGGTMTFSTYVKGFTEALCSSKLIVRGYVTFEDASGKRHTVYSDTVNRSVNGISDYHEAK